MAAHLGAGEDRWHPVKMFRLMKNAFLLAAFTVLSFTLVGCGDIQSHQSYPRAVVQVTRHGHPLSGQTVGVAIHAYREAPFSVPQPVVTNRDGVATADFPTMWTNSVFSFPNLGPVPKEAPRPQYLVFVGGQQVRVTPKTPDTTYSWNGERWETKTTVALP